MSYVGIIWVRFSKPDYQHSYGRSLRQDVPQEKEAYTEFLYQPSRLEKRFLLFEKFCLETFLSFPASEHLFLAIDCSSSLPPSFQKELCKLQEKSKGILIFQDFSYDQIISSILTPYPTSTPYYIARLDDDDGLHSTFHEKCRNYCVSERAPQTVLSFSEGFFYEESEHRLHPVSSPKIACGLTVFGRVGETSIPSTGSHRKVDSKFELIIDSSPSMYVVTEHSVNMSRDHPAYAHTTHRRIDKYTSPMCESAITYDKLQQQMGWFLR